MGKGSRNDWKIFQNIFNTAEYSYAIFFAHLVLEKLFKANWIKANEGNSPPKIHHLVYLAEKSGLIFTDEETNFG